ncbi:MAG: SDR family NAD(P)-dependent oxidoreductase [Desulfocapsaceae bacterium]|nr:SDR family NAD(P)-dependent oxidoreductase [Desulfocapsaceae bacterium]
MIFDFQNHNVLVTGATRGIGKAIATSFLKSGARVIGIYSGNEQAAEQFRDEVDSLAEQLILRKCDVSSQAEVESLFHYLDETIVTLDVLVNNAGVRRDSVLALMSNEDWQRVIDINLTGTFYMAKQAVLLMMKKKYGRIINITSPVSYLGFAGQANYAASKAGQVAMTKTLAKETAKKKITVNCVSPGFIHTDLIDDLTDDKLSDYKKMVPMRRFGTTEEVADAVLFLASPSSAYITGAVLEVNGGL